MHNFRIGLVLVRIFSLVFVAKQNKQTNNEKHRRNKNKPPLLQFVLRHTADAVGCKVCVTSLQVLVMNIIALSVGT